MMQSCLRLVKRWAFLMSTFWAVSHSMGLAQEQGKDVIEFPQDTSQPVIVLDFTGGFRAPDPPGFTRTPFLRVYSDGKVITGQNDPNQEVHRIEIGAQAVQELARMMVADQKFFDANSRDIQTQVEAQPNRIMIADAPTTEITLRTAEREHRVAVYALSVAASQMKSIEAVGRLLQIEFRLKALHCVATLGIEPAEKLTREANEYLRREHPELHADLTTNDLRWVNQYAKRKQIVFVRNSRVESPGFSLTVEQRDSETSMSVREISK